MLSLLLALAQTGCVYPSDPTKDTPNSLATLAQACRAQIAIQPRDSVAYLVLGYTLVTEPAAALKVLEAGLNVMPENHALLGNAGLSYRQVGRFEDAIAALAHAARLDTTDADALVQAGLIAHDLRRYGQALQLFRHALKRHEDGTTWGYMARSLRALGNHAEAVRDWERAERLTPHGFIDEAGDRQDYNSSRAAIGLPPSSHD